MKPAIMMGDPEHFRIAAGANPFTRDWLGRRKRVSRKKAVEQWHRLAQMLTDLGIAVYVIPPRAETPCLVYPANAGFLAHDGTFVLSRLLPSRAGEIPEYEKFLEGLGFKTARVERRFEGEAEFFPCGDKMIFTNGKIEEQRFVWRLGIPPWKRIYGFRSDPAARVELVRWFPRKEIVSLELVKENFYHGDTCLCSFGKNREHLMAYMPAIAEADRPRLRELAGDRLIEISDADAALYAANSFYFETEGVHGLVMPQGVSRELREEVRRRGVQPILADVSEFLLKGGGSVKCMIGTLGPLPESKKEEVLRFRKEHLYRGENQ